MSNTKARENICPNKLGQGLKDFITNMFLKVYKKSIKTPVEKWSKNTE